MACEIVQGPRVWEMERDEDGHRNYQVTHLIKCDPLDGPANALLTPGLPLPGTIWNFGYDVDIWAMCKLKASIKQYGQKPTNHFEVTQHFSTKSDTKRCKDQQIEDPLMMPPKVSGGTSRYTRESVYDRFGDPIINSSFEQIRGPQVEFDRFKTTVNIEMNVPNLLLPFVTSFINGLNDTELWEHEVRTVKLSDFSWEKKYYGACYSYYTWKFTFEIDPEGWDRDILDEGTKVIKGNWVRDTMSPRYTDYLPDSNADPSNPADYVRFKDWNGELSRVVLDGQGRPTDLGDGTGTGFPRPPGNIHVEDYPSVNFLLLGIPTVL